MLDFADADADAPASGREGAAPVTAPVRLLGLGAGTESAVIGSGRPLRADGMAGAVRAGMRDAGVTFADLHFRLSDVNGENYGFRENALAMSRVLRDSKPTFPLWHCADSLGEVGAASGAALVVFGRDEIARGYAPGERALGMLSADSGPRGAFVLGPAPRGEGN